MTELIPIEIDAAEPSRTAPRLEGQAVHSSCPVCGFGTRQLDRFCRQCGINLEHWQNAATGSLYATSTITQEFTESPPAEEEHGVKRDGKVNPTFPLGTGPQPAPGRTSV